MGPSCFGKSWSEQSHDLSLDDKPIKCGQERIVENICHTSTHSMTGNQAFGDLT